MGFLIGEIIAFLAGAALVGVLIGWALFGGKKALPSAAASGGAPEAGGGAEAAGGEALRKQLSGLEAERDGLQGKLTERDEKLAELRNHLDETSRYRVEMAEELGKQQERVKELEGELRRRGEPAGGDHQPSQDEAVAELRRQLTERDEVIVRLERSLGELKAASSSEAPRVTQLEAEIAELKATLESGGQLETSGDEGRDKDVFITRLREEITGLKAAYEAAERSLEEQDGAIDQLTQDLVKAQQKIAQLDAPRPRPVVAAQDAPAPSTPQPSGDEDDGEGEEVTVAIAAFDLPHDTAPAAPAVVIEDALEGDEEATIAMPVFEFADEESAPAVPPPVPHDSPTSPRDTGSFAKVEGPAAAAAEVPVAGSVGGEVAEVASVEGKPAAAAVEVPAEASLEAEVVAASLEAEAAEASEEASAAVEAIEAVEVEAVAREAEAPVRPDDLKRIRGIGPALAKRLNAAGIVSFKQLAAVQGEQIDALAAEIKVKADKIKKGQWIEQAQTLALDG